MAGTFLRHGSNAALALVALALALACATRAVAFWPAAAGLGALGFFVSEYTTHRFAFHAPPLRNAFLLRLQHRLHYDHHGEPGDLGLLFLPLWFALPIAALYGALAYAVLRDRSGALSFLLGAVVALLYYEWVHYVAHIAFVPRTPFGRWIKKYHLRHHFLNERLWFGVTNPLVDVAGFTYRRTARAGRSETTRVLYPR